MIDDFSSTNFSEKMKVRDSGMPESEYWETLFDVPLILRKMRIDSTASDLAEVGCGYGTFTIPAAREVRGTIYTYDIEESMVRDTENRAADAGVSNIKAILRDVIADTTGLQANCVDYVMLFNILHHETPLEILAEAWRILRPDGLVGCIHWNYDANTPRGPTMDIRPKPEQVRKWMISAGFTVDDALIELPPYHYGWLGKK